MKARLKFSKTGTMRFIGHLDLMRYFQKAFRRADIAISYSQGYSPHQLMSFASPLGIGLSSDAEYMDLVLEDTEQVSDFITRINVVMNDEITVTDFILLREEARSSMSVLAGCDYCIAVKPGKDSFLCEPARRKEMLEQFLGRESVLVLKKTKRSERMEDIRENIYCLTDSPEAFAAFTGRDCRTLSLEKGGYLPVLYCQLTAGSIVNIKPEQVLKALCEQEKETYDPFAYQIHRMEMYADIHAKKGEIHTLASEIPCSLAALSEFERIDSFQ